MDCFVRVEEEIEIYLMHRLSQSFIHFKSSTDPPKKILDMSEEFLGWFVGSHVWNWLKLVEIG